MWGQHTLYRVSRSEASIMNLLKFYRQERVVREAVSGERGCKRWSWRVYRERGVTVTEVFLFTHLNNSIVHIGKL